MSTYHACQTTPEQYLKIIYIAKLTHPTQPASRALDTKPISFEACLRIEQNIPQILLADETMVSAFSNNFPAYRSASVGWS